MSIQLPSLKSLKTLCDKMKNLSTNITICCISTGDLSFIVETESAIVVSRYFNLKIDQVNRSNDNGKGAAIEHVNNKNLEISCCIDTKILSMCFGSLQVV